MLETKVDREILYHIREIREITTCGKKILLLEFSLRPVEVDQITLLFERQWVFKRLVLEVSNALHVYWC